MKNETKIRLTKSFTFEMAHALPGYDGACKNIHGHSYRLEVTVIGTPLQEPGHPKDGMVMDFKDLKRIINDQVVNIFDHSLVLPTGMPDNLLTALRQQFDNIVTLPFQPSCENLLLYFVQKIRPDMPVRVELKWVRLYETANSFAEWNAEDR
ncbi:MAG: 6-pyruvoyl tetrahydropterin synthase family protein [Saprospiraceae bacterium]